MKNFKKLLAASVASSLISIPVFANEGLTPSEIHDATLIFHHTNSEDQTMQLATLTDQEMRETEGAIIPVALYGLGVLAGGYGGGYGYLAGGGGNPYGFTSAVITGAAGGLVGPVRSISTGLITFTGGFLSGYAGNFNFSTPARR